MLYPMFALVIFTYSLLFLNFFWRVQAVRRKQVSIEYFRTFDDGDAPEHIKAGGRHYANLFELPVLFYCVSLAAMALDLGTPLLVNLGWAFVVCRIVHATIHMSYNHVGHRALAFWCGATVLLAMWVTLVTTYQSLP
jgi:hypothetical protein